MEKRDLTRGSILGNILTFSLSDMLSYFLQILYGLADLFVTGRYCDVASITSVSNGAQVMYMFTVVIIGLASPAGSLLSIIICGVVYRWMMKHGKLK